MIKIMLRLYEKSPFIFWLIYAVIYAALGCAGLVFTYWAGKSLYEMFFNEIR